MVYRVRFAECVLVLLPDVVRVAQGVVAIAYDGYVCVKATIGKAGAE